MSESPDGGEYRPERKFGMPEDQDRYQGYFDDEGNVIGKDAWLQKISKRAEVSRKAGKSTRSRTITLPPLPGGD